MELPEKINAMALLTYDVRQIVADLKYNDVKESDINLDAIMDYIYEDSSDYFGTNNLIFTDENGEGIG